MNKRFFKFETELSIKSILKYLNISEEVFYEHNKKNINTHNFKINQFSSFSNSLDDSLFFLNKTTPNHLKSIKGVCLIKIPSENKNLQNNIVIPSENPKFDY